VHQSGNLYARNKINITNHAAVVHQPTAAAVRNLLPQIWQPHIGSEAINQILLSVLARAPAFWARQPNNLAWIFVESERATGHFDLPKPKLDSPFNR
jgi:hypothetical protein